MTVEAAEAGIGVLSELGHSPSAGSDKKGARARNRGADLWQTRLLPWMVAVLIGSALLFAIATAFHYDRIYKWLTLKPQMVATTVMWTGDAIKPTNFAEQMQLAEARARFDLERETISRRYNHASQFIANRLWSRFMGFMTGMILAVVGAAFVLGKLGDAGNQLSGGGGGWSLDLRTTSPGVVLALLGTVLIGMALQLSSVVTTSDAPIYFAAAGEGLVAEAEQPLANYSITADPAAAREPGPAAGASSDLAAAPAATP